MTFKLADAMLHERAAADALPAATRRLDMRLTVFARGVAVYEMPVVADLGGPGGVVDNGVLMSLAETTMTAAATTTVPDHVGVLDVSTRAVCGQFHSPVAVNDAQRLRAEAIVVSNRGDAMVVEADVLADGCRVASFEATCAIAR